MLVTVQRTFPRKRLPDGTTLIHELHFTTMALGHSTCCTQTPLWKPVGQENKHGRSGKEDGCAEMDLQQPKALRLKRWQQGNVFLRTESQKAGGRRERRETEKPCCLFDDLHGENLQKKSTSPVFTVDIPGSRDRKDS